MMPAKAPEPDPEKVEALAKVAFEELAKAEEKVGEAVDAVAPLTFEGKDVTEDMAEEAATATEAAVSVAILAVQSATRTVSQKTMEMGKSEAALKAKGTVEFMAMSGKLKHCKKKIDDLKVAVQALRKRPKDERTTKAQREVFDKFDEDKDGFLKGEELAAFAKAEYSFEPSEEQVAKVLRCLGGEEPGVPFEKLQRLRATVAVEKALASATERESKQVEVQDVAGDADKEFKEAVATAEKAKTLAGGLGSRLLVQLRASVEEVEKEAAASKALVEKAEGLLEKLAPTEGEEQDEATKHFIEELTSKFKLKGTAAKTTAEATTALVDKAKKRFKHASVAETEALRLQVVVAVRGAMQAKKKTGEQLFAQAAAKKEALKQDQFVSFVKSLADLCPGEVLPESLRQDTIDVAKVEGLFGQATGTKEDGSLSKDRFLWLFTRLGYAVLKETPLAAERGGEATRQLQPGEVAEALDLAESKAEDGTKHLRVRALKDGAEGWALVADASPPAGDDGVPPPAPTPRMEPAGCAFVCVKETILTGALKISEGETVRRVAKGEIVEASDFEKKDEACGVMRIECKAARDGKTGWVSVAGNTGLAFLERLR